VHVKLTDDMQAITLPLGTGLRRGPQIAGQLDELLTIELRSKMQS